MSRNGSKYCKSGHSISYDESFAEVYQPVIYDPYQYGRDHTPALYFRIIESKTAKCIQYLYYWDKQDCKKDYVISEPNTVGSIFGLIFANAMPNASACKQVNIAFPIEMNTISSPNGIVKTVESEKEAFNCRVTGNVPQGFGSNAIKEVTIFTEIFEDLIQGKIIKMSESTTCMKPVGPAPITSKTIICQASKDSVIPF